ncbi:BTAD domain-containing putative transcriptional regulator [Nonomuraea polychroma]|uniref:AfsR/SARP family transcriptional regulator n=1 Tax=Nonomuraea polychroma TaxID=46176 RepID=UPI003D93D045
MHFRVLGPLEVECEGRLLRFSRSRERCLIVAILLEPGMAVSLDRLTGLLWEDEPPESARRTVQSHVARVRAVLRAAGAQEHGVDLVSTGRGYAFKLPPDAVDVQRLRTLLARADATGDPMERVALLRAGLDLWRGRTFDDAPSEWQRVRLCAEIDELRMWATEEWLAALLSLGRHQETLPELARLTPDHPTRERLIELHMRALHQAGRRAEALALYSRAAERLSAELGVQPSPALRRMRDAVTDDDQDDLPVQAKRLWVMPAELPAGVDDFTGRDDELAKLDELRVDSHAVRVAVITGTAGVGKTALALQWAHAASKDFPDGQLYVNLRGQDGEDKLRPLEVLHRLLHSLGTLPQRMPPTEEEAAGLYRSLMAGKGRLVVLDNAYGAEQVRPLLPGSPMCVVLITSRDRMAELEGARHLSIDVLPTRQAIELLGRVAGQQRTRAEPEAAHEIVRLCGCLPLAVRVAASRLASRPELSLAALAAHLSDEWRRLDHLEVGNVSVRASLALSYCGLGEVTRRLFRLLSAVNVTDFTSWVACALLDAPAAEVERHLDLLVDANLLRISTTDSLGQTRYRFHDLVRLYGVEVTHAEESPRTLQAALERVGGAYLLLAEQAHLRRHGGDYATLHGKAPRWNPGGAAVELVRQDPLGWLETERHALLGIIQQTARADLDELCWDLALTVTTLFETRNSFDDWRESSEHALVATRRTGNRRGEAAMLYSLGSLQVFLSDFATADQLFSAALELFDEVGERHGYALALRNAALYDRVRGRFLEALDRYATALEILRAVRDRYTEAHVLINIAQVLIDQGTLKEAESLLGAAIEIFKAIESRRGEALSLYQLGEVYRRHGNLRASQSAFEAVLAYSREGADPIGEVHGLLGLGDLHLEQGAAASAERAFSEALVRAREIGERFGEARALFALGVLESAREQREAGRLLLEKAAQIFAELRADLWERRVREALAVGGPG